jgi:hypothetical protein
VVRYRRGEGPNRSLPPLPDDEAFIEAVRAIVTEHETMMDRARTNGYGYYKGPGASANDVAAYLRLTPANRLGNGAVKGAWSGSMSAGLRAAPRLQSLAKRGVLRAYHNPGEYRWRYEVRP